MRREDGEIAAITAAGVSNVKCIDWDSPLEVGDTCVVGITFRYQGPVGTVKAYAAIGNKQWYGFDEILDSGWKNVEVPDSPWTVTMMIWLSIPITSAISPGIYDLYGKIDGLFPDVSPTYKNVIEVTGVVPPPKPDYRNLKIISYSPTQLNYGDTFRVTFRVDHIGEAESGKLHVAVGRRDTWFDEEPGMTVERVVSFPESMDWESKTINVSIPVENIDPGVYEFYAKLMAVTGPDLFVYSPNDVLEIKGVPPEVVLSGIITRIEPFQFDVGQPIDLEIDFNAYMESLYYQIRGWETSLQAIVNGLSDSDAQTHYGRDGSRTGETLNLGAMPDRDLSGTLTLYGRGLAIPTQDWQELDSKDLVITRKGVPPPPPCSPGEMKCVGPDLYGCIGGEWVFVQANAPECVLPPEKKFPWVAAALIGGGAAVAIAAAAKKPKKPGA